MTTDAGTSTRAVVVALLAALAAGAVPAAATGAAAPGSQVAHRATAPDPPAGARLTACRPSPLIGKRTAVVGTWMRPLANGRRLAVRIDLYERIAGGRWTLRSDVPGLGTWTMPSDALVGTRAGDVFKYRQAVDGLAVPASYRFRVGFRWLGAAGAVVRETSVVTGTCRQPDLRPDLVLKAVRTDRSSRGRGLVRYAVTVSNVGRSPATHVVVAATLPGDAAPNRHLRTVDRLEPGAGAVVVFTGPGCAAGAQPAAFVADPSNALDEVHEANNELAATCPAP
ncbi:MAG TPA: CARDB domain-containing protein [Conexibacter sp.]|jgi:hypothetical protein|nr:CARDB domain-containing protein [Conexibacter sp.]